jgi:subtilase family protein/Calx-beta domain-containing protein/CARDB protein
MARRVVSTFVLVALLTLSGAAGTGSQERALVAAELHQKAHQHGVVRVLVHVAAPYAPEAHGLSRAEVMAQRQNIASAQQLVRAGLRGVAHRVVREFRGAMPLLAIEVGPDGLQMLESLRGIVTDVVEEVPRHPSLVESVPRIQADQAAALGYDGTGAVIVIMDTGVDKSHPFFDDGSGTSRIVHEACFSSNSVGGTSLCPNGQEQDLTSGSGDACDTALDGCDHGTLVAGIAAGRGVSFNGVAPGADIVSIQVFSRFNDPAFCGGMAFTPCVGSFPSDELAASVYVRDTLLAVPMSLNIAAINLSLGSQKLSIPCDANFPAESALINDLRARGVATVAASGNAGLNGQVTAPACIGSAISVGATTDPPAEAIASFSNRAPGLSLLAPGVTITTSAPGGGFQTADGTSMAAPHVAGVFAIFREAVPGATVDQVLAALQSTGQSIGGFKRIKVIDALATFPNVVPAIQFSSPTFTASEGDTTGTATVTLTRTGPPDVLAVGSSSVRVSTTTGTATPGTTGAADHVPLVNQIVTFGPGETSKNVQIRIRGDFTIEPNETIGLALSAPSGALLGAQPTAVLTILNDDVAGVVAFDQPTYTVNETAGTATITLRRTGGLAAGAVSLVSTVAGGSATAGADYTPFTNKPVTFLGGATTATFTVTIVNDTLAELDETVKLQITGVGGGAAMSPLNTSAVLTIVSEDVAGTVQFAQPAYEVAEGTASVPITVNRTGGAASGVTVQYRVVPLPGDPGTATGGGVDYTLATGTLSFGANETAKTFAVKIVNDTVIEVDETVRVELINPSTGLIIGAQDTTTLTIHDNDAPTFKFSAATYTVTEGATSSVTVVRTNGVGSPVTVGYQVQVTGTGIGGGQDYTLADGTVSFAVGVTSQTITIPTAPDTLFEGNETIVLMLVSPSVGTIVNPATATVTIVDNDTPGTIQFSAGAYSVIENAGPAIVRVTRTGANLASGMTVQFTTTNGTATAGADYTSSTQVLTFAALEAFKDVQIPILNDGLPEGNETVALTLSNPTGGAKLGALTTAVLTILDDEQSLQFSAPVYVVSEAAGAATVTVVRIGPAFGTVTVDYASAAGSAALGADYTNVGGTLTFGPGVASRAFTVPIVNDPLFERSESVALLLTNPTGSALLGQLSTATITVVDNDPPGAIRFSAPAYSVSEAGVATITVQRINGGTAGAVTVDYATVPGGTATVAVDYLVTAGTLTFNANETSKTFTVRILNDAFDEPNETVNLALSNPTGGATLGTPSTAVLTIVDEDVPGPITFSAPTYTVAENVGVALIKVNRTGGAAGVTVDFTTADGSAIAPSDYTAVSQTLSFAAGETSKTIAIPIVDDGIREGNETLRLILSNPTGGAALGAYPHAVLTITDNEVGATVQFSAAAYSVAENVAGGVATVTITRTASTTPDQTVRFSTTVGGTAVKGTDFMAVSNQLVTFTGTQASVTVPITIIDNTNIVGSRTVNLALTNPTGGLSLGVPRAAVLTILEDDATVRFSSGTYTVTEGGTATLTVTRTGGTVGAATVGYTTNSGSAPGQATAGVDYTSKTGTLVFAPGVTSQTITVATIADVLVEGNETFTVTLSNPSPAASIKLGAPSTATVTISDNDAFGSLRLASSAYSVTEGGSAALVVSRTGGSAGTVTVQYVTSDGGGGGNAAHAGDYTSKAGVLTFANGVISQTITVPTTADTLLEGPETFTVTLSNPTGGATLGSPASAVVTIVDDETPRLQFATGAYTVAEAAGAVTLTVQRVGPTTVQNTVQYALAGVTATGGGADFVGTGGVLTFTPGIASRSIVVPITNDTINEPSETFKVTLSNPTNGAILGTPSVATVTITDNDPAGAVQFSQNSFAAVEGRTATITVTRTGTAGPVTVDFATAAGSATATDDYSDTSGTLTFQAGETTKTFTVTTASDSLTEGSESVSLTLSNPTNGLALGSQSTATLWILDEEQSIQFGAAAYSVIEGGSVVVSVTRSGVPAGTVTVNYQLLGGTATQFTDFTLTPGTGTLTFAPGVATLTITVKTLNNATIEGPKSISLQLSSPSGAVLIAPTTTQIALLDNDRADLIVGALTGPAQAATGSPMTVMATVRNQAGGPAPATTLGIFISASSNTPGDGTQVGRVPIPALGSGASFSAVATVNVPAGVPVGQYFLSAVANFNGVAIEDSLANNGFTAPAQLDIVFFK